MLFLVQMAIAKTTPLAEVKTEVRGSRGPKHRPTGNDWEQSPKRNRDSVKAAPNDIKRLARGHGVSKLRRLLFCFVTTSFGS